MSEPAELQVDPNRLSYPETGFYVRARHGDKWISTDIATLDTASLRAWLRSYRGDNDNAETIILRILGHD